jgi:hypothetical protein
MDGSCPAPFEITTLPPNFRPNLNFVGPFPNVTKLTVVAADSAMVGDIKCAGIDDQQCIQTAIDNMNVTGGTVILSDGTFILNNQITLCNNLNLKGQGMNKTILFVQNNASPYVSSGTVRCNRISNIYLSNFSFLTLYKAILKLMGIERTILEMLILRTHQLMVNLVSTWKFASTVSLKELVLSYY